jgi:hypothetical protein
MCADHESHDEFDETARSIAREVSEFVERTVEQFDSDQLAGAMGVDPERARDWVQSAGGWLRNQVERVGDEVAARGTTGGEPASRPAPTADTASKDDEMLRGAGPHPLDLPTEEQGLALAALDSGRWTVEPGSNALAARAEGPGPSDALGLVRELRARDWIAADGEVTLVGRHALSRWLDSLKTA